MAKQKKNRVVAQDVEPFWGRELEYVMPRAMFEDMTRDCKGDKNKYAMDYINQTYGLLGHVTSLVLEDHQIQITPAAVLE